MDIDRSGIVYRMNAGYRLRIAGDNAHNDGIQAEMDFGYRSRRFFADQFSLETGSSTDLFGETQNLTAYFQLNYHASERWTLSLRALGGGVNDEKETTAPGSDNDDFGGLFGGAVLGAFQLDKNFFAGLRCGYQAEVFGAGGGDQGTQHSLSTLLNLAYLF